MLATVVSILAMLSTTSGVGQVSTEHWSYDDTDAWGNLDGSYCAAKYTTQSPININTNTGLNHECTLDELDWYLGSSVEVTSFEIENTGHSVQITPSGNYPGDLLIGDDLYCLEQFHIHWGETESHGSEHTINEVAAALEMHFVHYKCEYGSIAGALSASTGLNDPYTLAVVAVLYIVPDDDNDVDHSRYSSLLRIITHHAKDIPNEDDTYTLSAHHYQMSDLVRDNIDDNPSFFYYKGSLTTPSCNPIVHWYVLRDPMYVTLSELDALRSHISNPYELVTHNCRPVQTNLNEVYWCGDQGSHSADDSDDDDIHHAHFDSGSDDSD